MFRLFCTYSILFSFFTFTLYSQTTNGTHVQNGFLLSHAKPQSSAPAPLKREIEINGIDTSRKMYSVGIGTSLYRFSDVVFISFNVMPYLGQRVYIEAGTELYGALKWLNYTRPYFALNFSLLYSTDFLNNRLHVYFGSGFSVYVMQTLAFAILTRFDYAFEKYTMGLELRYGFVKGSDKFFKYPLLGINFLF